MSRRFRLDRKNQRTAQRDDDREEVAVIKRFVYFIASFYRCVSGNLTVPVGVIESSFSPFHLYFRRLRPD
jgi:hypothetical protein